MRIGTSIGMIAVGLILALAVPFDLGTINLQLVGWILALVGVLGLDRERGDLAPGHGVAARGVPAGRALLSSPPRVGPFQQLRLRALQAARLGEPVQHDEPQPASAGLLVPAHRRHQLRRAPRHVADGQTEGGQDGAVPVGGGVVEPAGGRASSAANTSPTLTASPCRHR